MAAVDTPPGTDPNPKRNASRAAESATAAGASQLTKKAAASSPWAAAAVVGATAAKKVIDTGRDIRGDGAKGAGRVVAGGAARGASRVAGSETGRNPLVWFVVVAVLALLGIPAVALASLGGGSPNPLALQLSLTPALAGGGTADIPPIVYQAYVQAAAQASSFDPDCAVRPAILAGIGWKETTHGTFGGGVADADGDVAPPIIGVALNGTGGNMAIGDTDNGIWDGDTVWDRAVGPMQFIPSSWRIYGQDGNGDGIEDPHNVFDASLAAVAHLCAASPVDMNASEAALRTALFAYNRSSAYVNSVMERIAYYDLALLAGGGDPTVLLANPNFTACDSAITELETGQVDQRVISMLSILTQRYSIYVCPFIGQHYQCIGGGSLATRPTCTESHHWYGRAADISMVNGQPVNASNQAAKEIVEFFTTFASSDPARPTGIGSPWPEFSGLPGFFHDGDHTGHIHLGWCGPRYSGGQFGDSCPAGMQPSPTPFALTGPSVGGPAT